ncbi:MAG TPA: hypothetical protein PL196_00095 [Burkholderiaceae bacterium]|nr:hypothetical protein [Burkholderiaceae bacterium]
MTHADAIRDLLEPVLGADYAWQFGRWQDSQAPAARFAVLRPVGGVGAALVRQPQFILQIIGRRNEIDEVADAADAVVETCRNEAGALVYVEAGEPQFIPTADGRPIFEIALSAITT